MDRRQISQIICVALAVDVGKWTRFRRSSMGRDSCFVRFAFVLVIKLKKSK